MNTPGLTYAQTHFWNIHSTHLPITRLPIGQSGSSHYYGVLACLGSCSHVLEYSYSTTGQVLRVRWRGFLVAAATAGHQHTYMSHFHACPSTGSAQVSTPPLVHGPVRYWRHKGMQWRYADMEGACGSCDIFQKQLCWEVAREGEAITCRNVGTRTYPWS